MDEQFYDSNNSYETPSQEIPVYTPPTPKKREKKNHVGLRVCALALVFALLGGVEPFDIVFGRGDSRFKFLWDEARSLFDFVRGDGRRGQFYAVDLAGQPQ